MNTFNALNIEISEELANFNLFGSQPQKATITHNTVKVKANTTFVKGRKIWEENDEFGPMVCFEIPQ